MNPRKQANISRKQWEDSLNSRGFVRLPNCLIFCQKELGLTSQELTVLCGLLVYAFENLEIYPSVASLGRASGMKTNTIRNHLRSLDGKGFIRRMYNTGDSTTYNVAPLIGKLADHLCTNPIQKRIPGSLKNDRPPPPYSDTKEHVLRKRYKNKNAESLGVILGKRKIVYNNKR
jgi:DNA-binding MarR family transcriptional regulator